MTQVTFFINRSLIEGYRISGHADEDTEGPLGSLVCAGISALSMATYNGLEGVCQIPEEDLKTQLEDGFLSVYVLDRDHLARKEVQVLLKTLQLGLENIAGQYSQYIKINIQEVSDAFN
ncbi:MAG: ribosomal-processing cysteine protease Prp [Tissierellia bacterium]|nr:ribosomal-processing cysteine protease Prp [Tissierellia bacterium]